MSGVLSILHPDIGDRDLAEVDAYWRLAKGTIFR